MTWQALWLPIVALSGVATGMLLVGGVAVRRGAVSPGRTDRPRQDAPASLAFVLGPRALEDDQLDVELEIRAAVYEQDAAAAARLVRLETAIQAGLALRTDRRALRQVLADVLRNAIGHTSGGRVLVGAGRRGGRIQISVLDDGRQVDPAVQAADLRATERLVALQGGTLDITVRSGAGTTVLIRLPEPARVVPAAAGTPAVPPSSSAITAAPSLAEATRSTAIAPAD